jgi:DNA modification methylase
MELNNKCTLLFGDCLERMKEIPDGSVDMILTDPPYGTTSCKWDSIIPIEPMWVQLKRIIKPNGAIVLFGSQPFTSILTCSNLKMFKYDWYWNKRKPVNFLNAKKQPLRKVESISVFYAKQCTYNPQGLIYNPKLNKRGNSTETNRSHGLSNFSEYSNYPVNTLDFISDNGLHPTQKPVALMEYLIKTYTNENETVLDFTMGSCTTGVACVNTNRSFIGIELDETYFKIAKERINNS